MCLALTLLLMCQFWSSVTPNRQYWCVKGGDFDLAAILDFGTKPEWAPNLHDLSVQRPTRVPIFTTVSYLNNGFTHLQYYICNVYVYLMQSHPPSPPLNPPPPAISTPLVFLCWISLNVNGSKLKSMFTLSHMKSKHRFCVYVNIQ